MLYISYVIYIIAYVICYMLYVIYIIAYIICYMLYVIEHRAYLEDIGSNAPHVVRQVLVHIPPRCYAAEENRYYSYREGFMVFVI
jgi:hypothetical protein